MSTWGTCSFWMEGVLLTSVGKRIETRVSTGCLGTNRDGTSRCPFVPGQRNFLVLVSLCPEDKGRSKCPRTNPSVPGRSGTKSPSFKKQKTGKKTF